MNLLDDLFINVCILTTVLFMFSNHVKNRFLDNLPERSRQVCYGFLGAFLGITLLVYSFDLGDNIRLDLRYMATIITTLFSGPIAGAICVSTLIVVRAILFGVSVGSLVAIPTQLISFVIVYYLSKHPTLTLRTKYILSNIFLTGLFSIHLALFTRPPEPEALILLLLNFWVAGLVGAYVAYQVLMSIASTNARFDRLEKETRTDFLTGLSNKRKYQEVLNAHIINSKMTTTPFSLLLLDLDCFKQVNDTYGHPAGDAILRQLGKILVRNTRPEDVVSRVGGEEFTVLLNQLDREQAISTAERIRKAVEAYPFELLDGTILPLTTSIGVATFPEHATSGDTLYELADIALYQAKSNGRNRVISN